MKLSIIIPAYNEEKSIAAIIRKCLDAKKDISQKAGIGETDIIVVSDGSTDDTAKIAERFIPQIKLIAYEKNKGYGKAIKAGFENAEGDLVSFLDADATCDPLNFIDLINKLEKENADICVGSRMGSISEMPRIRKIGNKVFKTVINMIANTDISDAASGMRVIRKERLNQLYPLPDGLNFTPAMTCRAALDPTLKIVEVDISYGQRQGKSKLSLIRDGIRFMSVIISIALTYKPLKTLGSAGIFLSLISFIYGSATLVFYLREHFIQEGDVYRLISVMVFGVSGILLLGLARLTDKAVGLISSSFKRKNSDIGNAIRYFFSWKVLRFISALLFFSGIALNYQTIISWISTRKISTHWSYVVTGGYLTLLGIVGFTFTLIDYILDLIKQKIEYEILAKTKK